MREAQGKCWGRYACRNSLSSLTRRDPLPIFRCSRRVHTGAYIEHAGPRCRGCGQGRGGRPVGARRAVGDEPRRAVGVQQLIHPDVPAGFAPVEMDDDGELRSLHEKGHLPTAGPTHWHNAARSLKHMQKVACEHYPDLGSGPLESETVRLAGRYFR